MRYLSKRCRRKCERQKIQRSLRLQLQTYSFEDVRRRNHSPREVQDTTPTLHYSQQMNALNILKRNLLINAFSAPRFLVAGLSQRSIEASPAKPSIVFCLRSVSRFTTNQLHSLHPHPRYQRKDNDYVTCRFRSHAVAEIRLSCA